MNKPWLRWLLWLQCVLLLVMVAGMLANKLEVVEFRLAFMTFVRALQAVMLVTAIGFIGLLFVWWKKYRASIKPALYTVLLGGLPVVFVFALVGQGLKVPAIHNISTDLDNPPEFRYAYQNRQEGLNSLDAPADEVRQKQRAYYGDTVKSLVLDLSPDAAFDLALNAARGLNFTITDVDKAAGRIEAIEETLFFGFKDDLVVRVAASDQGSVIDVRSVSRVGMSDLGANAKRINKLLQAIVEDMQ
ncbi:DUF1499 domain-containing protein [Simiduia litorea]|uniref:DUF1499 domain-containing protein n=1 Tax=Simiduia litorea TaxID=1435348 RepID=UPI0036F239CC